LQYNKTTTRFAARYDGNAQVAELVDALVSNTSAFTGIPVRPRSWVLKPLRNEGLFKFKMASVYILYSPSADKYYVGCTKDLTQRFEYHLLKEFTDSYTSKYSDWGLFYEIPGLTITCARKIETHIKNMKKQNFHRKS
jgi:putative endonuclease